MSHETGCCWPIRIPSAGRGDQVIAADYRFAVLPGVGHYAPDQAPARVTGLLRAPGMSRRTQAAQFSVGMKDALLHDTLFMHAR
jgi:hypothetical protein